MIGCTLEINPERIVVVIGIMFVYHFVDAGVGVRYSLQDRGKQNNEVRILKLRIEVASIRLY